MSTPRSAQTAPFFLATRRRTSHARRKRTTRRYSSKTTNGGFEMTLTGTSFGVNGAAVVAHDPLYNATADTAGCTTHDHNADDENEEEDTVVTCVDNDYTSRESVSHVTSSVRNAVPKPHFNRLFGAARLWFGPPPHSHTVDGCESTTSFGYCTRRPSSPRSLFETAMRSTRRPQSPVVRAVSIGGIATFVHDKYNMTCCANTIHCRCYEIAWVGTF